MRDLSHNKGWWTLFLGAQLVTDSRYAKTATLLAHSEERRSHRARVACCCDKLSHNLYATINTNHESTERNVRRHLIKWLLSFVVTNYLFIYCLQHHFYFFFLIWFFLSFSLSSFFSITSSRGGYCELADFGFCALQGNSFVCEWVA